MIMNNFKEDAYAVGKLEERWRTLLEEEIDNCAPMTFIACTAIAGMISEFRAEESVKIILSRGYREECFELIPRSCLQVEGDIYSAKG